MSLILVNAVSAKHGGARTIVESFVAAADSFPQHSFVVLAGFRPSGRLPFNIKWRYHPKSGAAAMAFSLLGAAFAHLRYNADILISFNNINTPLVPANRRFTYFHQLKAVDPVFTELKLRLIRLYLRHSREPVILQSSEVEAAFVGMFGSIAREIIVSWPGITIPETLEEVQREQRRIIVPLSSPGSPHKNFKFVQDVARTLGPRWRVVMTSREGLVDIGKETTNIEFIGTLNRERLFTEYRRATVCLVGSTHETVGLPIFEALAVGTPVVAFDAPYVRAFRTRFGISEGLTAAKTPHEAAALITALGQNSDNNIIVEHDFRQAEWEKILNKI